MQLPQMLVQAPNAGRDAGLEQQRGGAGIGGSGGEGAALQDQFGQQQCTEILGEFQRVTAEAASLVCSVLNT